MEGELIMAKKQDILDTLTTELQWAEENLNKTPKYNIVTEGYYGGQVDILKHLIKLFKEGCEE